MRNIAQAPSLWERTSNGYNLIGQDVIMAGGVSGLSVPNAGGAVRSYSDLTNIFHIAAVSAVVLYIVVSIAIEIGGKTEMPKIDNEYTETMSLRVSRETKALIEQEAEAQGLRQSDFLRQIIEKAVGVAGDDCIIRKSDLSDTMREKFHWWLKMRRRSTLKDLILEAINRGLGLNRWGD